MDPSQSPRQNFLSLLHVSPYPNCCGVTYIATTNPPPVHQNMSVPNLSTYQHRELHMHIYIYIHTSFCIFSKNPSPSNKSRLQPALLGILPRIHSGGARKRSGRVSIHSGRVSIHLGRGSIHSGRVSILLGRVSIHLGRVSGKG